MVKKSNGSTLGVPKEPDSNSASGVWSLSEQQVESDSWPDIFSGNDGSALFTSGDQGISFSYKSNFSFASNFTIEAMLYKASNNVGMAWIGSYNGSDNNQSQVDEGNVQGQVGLYNPSTGWLTINTISPVNTWFHLAIVRNSGTVTVYIDGVSRGSFSSSATYHFSGVQSNEAGGVGGVAGYWGGGFVGNINNFRICDRAVYTSNFAPLTANLTNISGCLLLLPMTQGLLTGAVNPLGSSLATQGAITFQSNFSPF